MASNHMKPSLPLRIKAVLAVVSMAILAGGLWFYKIREQQHLLDVEANLTAIARLKADQIADWRAERISNARVIMYRRALIKDISDFLSTPTETIAAEITRQFQIMRTSYRYTDVLLADPAGKIRLHLSGGTCKYQSAHLDDLAIAQRDRRPIITDLHTERDEPTPHLSVVAPLFTDEGIPRPIGAVILVSEAREFLYPLIRSWPLPSRTAETLLVRRDGDHVLYLNDLRYQPDTALKLLIPLSRTDVPAVMAVSGQQSFMTGRDYRGVEVAAVTMPVADSPWFIEAKIDAAEAFAAWRFQSVLMLVMFAALIGMTVVTGLAVWQRKNQVKHYRAMLRSEVARREEAERYRITIQSIGDAVIASDVEGRVEMMNTVAETLTGWSYKEARGRTLEEVFRIVNEESGETVESPVSKVLHQGKVVGLANHTVLIARDGTRRPIADSGAPVHDDSGAIIGVVMVFRDQTAERKLMNSLQYSERKYRHLFESMMDAFVSTDMEGFIQEYNSAYQAMLGYSNEELRGLRSLDMTPGEWHEFENRIIEEQIIPRGYSDVYEKEYRRRDGTVFPVELRRFLIRDDENRPVRMWAIVRDITERKRAEKTMRDNEFYIRAILDNLPVGIAVNSVAPKVVFSYMNDNFSKYYRASSEALSNPDGFWEAVYKEPDFRETMKKRVLEDCASGDPHRMHWRDIPIKRDGEETTFIEAMNVPLPGKDLVLSVVWDVTESKQAEAEREKLQAQLLQAQKMESVGRLAGGVAHDFNNMLNVIIGHAELALEIVSPDDPLREVFDEIILAARHSADLTRQLLAFARKQTIAPETFDLNTVVEGLLKMLGRLIGENIKLIWKPGRGLWTIYMEPSQVDQILVNLLVNARDAIAGTGRITIETGNVFLDEAYCADHAEFIPGEFVQIIVSDDGCGMDRETRDRIFEPFFTTKGVSKGTGLGLAMVYGIVKQNEGYINAYSEPGRGTTFKIYLPRHAGEGISRTVADMTDIPLGSGETVLIAEDEDSVMRVAKRMLVSLGYNVLGAPTPEAALKLAGEHPAAIRLLITDVIMPEMDGRHLSERMQVLYPDLKVLFMSGYAEDIISDRGVLKEGVHFIQKPFSKRDLARKVREALGG